MFAVPVLVIVIGPEAEGAKWTVPEVLVEILKMPGFCERFSPALDTEVWVGLYDVGGVPFPMVKEPAPADTVPMVAPPLLSTTLSEEEEGRGVFAVTVTLDPVFPLLTVPETDEVSVAPEEPFEMVEPVEPAGFGVGVAGLGVGVAGFGVGVAGLGVGVLIFGVGFGVGLGATFTGADLKVT